VLTSPDNTPDRIARLLLAEGQGADFHLAVAERLQTADERVWADLAPEDAAQQTFADPNVVLLWRTTPRANPVRFGLADSDYQQRQPDKGLITKQEVRAVSLARLQLRADSVVWDIGAGSGSVGLEAARLCPQGHVWAIETNDADVEIARRNQRTFHVSNHTLVQGKAPEHLGGWPDPDAVFIGGSGGELGELIALVLRRLRVGGTLVMNFVTLENLATATQALAAAGAAGSGIDWDVLQLQAARSKPILHMHRMAAENPVWIVCARVRACAPTRQEVA
jgi:precorrin-6Y C5,15-methyltransferase (decarboxylating)